ncbi:phosphatase PAP2 family protein [Enterococcus durans]|uniref:phosphatase PAP2 family protein n=1 Tax=Enterococcus durans TaxID=53345 RepID=UPI00321B5EE4
MKQKTTFHVVGTLFLFLFFILGYIVKYRINLLSGFDQTITEIIRTPYPDWNHYQLFITTFGNALTVIVVFLLVLAFLWWKKKHIELIWFATNFVVIAGIINPLIKLFVMRLRPTLPHLVVEHSYSFPSGHSAASMILYGTLLFLLPSLIKKKGIATLLQLLLAFIIVSVGASRIYLGVHFPSDVLGGYLLSLSWLFITYPTYREKKEQIELHTID